jgi:hypothetical protein
MNVDMKVNNSERRKSGRPARRRPFAVAARGGRSEGGPRQD